MRRRLSDLDPYLAPPWRDPPDGPDACDSYVGVVAWGEECENCGLRVGDHSLSEAQRAVVERDQ